MISEQHHITKESSNDSRSNKLNPSCLVKKYIYNLQSKFHSNLKMGFKNSKTENRQLKRDYCIFKDDDNVKIII